MRKFLAILAILAFADASAATLSQKQLQLARTQLAILKESMRNPASFSLIRIKFAKRTNDVCFTYRAQNGFGGYTVEQAAYSHKDGYISAENYIWNDTGCAHEGGVDVTSEVIAQT